MFFVKLVGVESKTDKEFQIILEPIVELLFQRLGRG